MLSGGFLEQAVRPGILGLPFFQSKPVVSFPTVGRQSESVPVGEEVVVVLLRPCGVVPSWWF
jgi:hypothetical protein